MIRALLSAFFLLSADVFAQAVTPSYPTQWYWVVGDTTPTTTVWNGATGAMVANSDATYQAWVGAALGLGAPVTAISASANNGSGLIRLTVATTNGMTTGDVDVVNGTGTVADGTWPITVIDANCTGMCRVDLQGSTFSGGSATTGALGGGSKIPTMVGLLAFINSTNAAALNFSFLGIRVATIGGTTALTNPLVQNNILTPTVSTPTVSLPQANLFGSVPSGVAFWIVNASGGNSLQLTYFDGTTPVNFNVGGGVGTIPPNVAIELAFFGNPTSNGSATAILVAGRRFAPYNIGGTGGMGVTQSKGTVFDNGLSALDSAVGGNGKIWLQPTGNIPGWVTQGGDCVINSSTGAQTCTSLNGIGTTPGGKQPVCIDIITKQLSMGTGGAC
jgi:hypothetical protein